MDSNDMLEYVRAGKNINEIPDTAQREYIKQQFTKYVNTGYKGLDALSQATKDWANQKTTAFQETQKKTEEQRLSENVSEARANVIRGTNPLTHPELLNINLSNLATIQARGTQDIQASRDAASLSEAIRKASLDVESTYAKTAQDIKTSEDVGIFFTNLISLGTKFAQSQETLKKQEQYSKQINTIINSNRDLENAILGKSNWQTDFWSKKQSYNPLV